MSDYLNQVIMCLRTLRRDNLGAGELINRVCEISRAMDNSGYWLVLHQDDSRENRPILVSIYRMFGSPKIPNEYITRVCVKTYPKGKVKEWNGPKGMFK